MFKRIVLALTFVTALGVAGLGVTNQAEARHCGGGGYGYYAAPAYYGPVYPRAYPVYRAYPAYYGNGPSFSYYSGYGGRRHGGWSFSIGF